MLIFIFAKNANFSLPDLVFGKKYSFSLFFLSHNVLKILLFTSTILHFFFLGYVFLQYREIFIDYLFLLY